MTKNTNATLPNKKDFLSPNEAIDFFKRMQEWPELYNNAPEDGCFARAHLIGIKAEDKGLEPKKVWAFKTSRPELIYMRAKLDTRDNERDFLEKNLFEFGFHVAISLPVKTADGKVENLIFDPLVFDGPVTRKQWAKEINAHEPSLSVKGMREEVNKGYNDFYLPGEKAPSDCIAHAKNFLQVEGKKSFFEVERVVSNWMNVYNFVEQEKSTKLAPIAMSIDEAQTRFDDIKNNPDYASNNPCEGCYARAYLITEEAKADGYNPKKIWYNAEENAKDFTFEFNAKNNFLNSFEPVERDLKFHVAAILPVRDNKGKVTELVFDPALFNGPVTKEQWGARLGGGKTRITEPNQVPSGYENSYSLNGFEPCDKVAYSRSLLKNINKNKYVEVERKNSAWMLIQQNKSEKESSKFSLRNLLSFKHKNRD